MEDTEDEQSHRPNGARRVTERITEQVAVIPRRIGAFERSWVTNAEQRRLSFVNRRGEHVDSVRVMSRIVLIWTMTATVLSLAVVLLASTDRLEAVMVVLSILYGLGTRKRFSRPRSTADNIGAVDERRGLILALVLTGVLLLLTVLVYQRSPVLARLLAIMVLLGHAMYRYISWRLDLFVLSSTSLWRFQGVLDFRVSSLEYSRIQAGPNATSGFAAWLPIGTISMDSAAQTGDLPMHRIGPVWGAEELAINIFHRRKRTALGVRVVNADEIRPVIDPDRTSSEANEAVRRRRPKGLHTTPPSKRRHP
jgi:hypothetical protein